MNMQDKNQNGRSDRNAVDHKVICVHPGGELDKFIKKLKQNKEESRRRMAAKDFEAEYVRTIEPDQPVPDPEI